MRSGSLLKMTRVHPIYASFTCRRIIDNNCRCIRDIVYSVNKFIHANRMPTQQHWKKMEWVSQQTIISTRTTHRTNKRIPIVLFQAEQTPARPIHFSESECKPFNGLSNDSANNQDKKKQLLMQRIQSLATDNCPSVSLKTHSTK